MYTYNKYTNIDGKKTRSWSQWKAGYERLCPRMLVDVHPENIKNWMEGSTTSCYSNGSKSLHQWH